MKRPWAALGLVLALCAIMPRSTQAQGNKSSGRPTMTQNYPNPFNPVTTQPFAVGGYPDCVDRTKQYRVTMRVYNMLTQLVAYPVLVGGHGTVTGGTPIRNIQLQCGNYEGFWDGLVITNGRRAASGMYLFVVEQDGVLTSSRAFVGK